MVTLAGGTDTLDEVVITLQDESGVDHWGRGLPPGVTQEQAEAFAWGPWDSISTRARRWSATGRPGPAPG